MFERFTDRARKVFALANREAQRFNHECVGPEHIFLGMLAESAGGGFEIFKVLAVDLSKAQVEVEKFIKPGPNMVTIGGIPRSSAAARVIRYAEEERKNLGHQWLGTEHLLLGLLREENGIPAKVLIGLGVKESDVRQAVEERSKLKAKTEKGGLSGDAMERPGLSYQKFTDSACKVMALANQEAHRFNHEYIGTEHLLLGIAKEGSSTGALVLRKFDIDLRKVRIEVEKLVEPGLTMVTTGKLGLTPRAKKVIEYAIEEASNRNYNYVGTEHLLLGLFGEKYGVAAQLLHNFGLSVEEVNEAIAAVPSSNELEDVRARLLIQHAAKEAQKQGRTTLHTDDYLLGILLEGSGVGAQALAALGVTLDQVREAIQKLTKPGTPPPANS